MHIRGFLRAHILPHFGGDPRYARLSYIDRYAFPDTVLTRFAREQPEFDDDERTQVFEALRDYFAICAADPGRKAGMPSRIVDDAWQIFVASAREYSEFCTRAFGAYLPHAPGGAAANDDDVQQTWRIACARNGISPNRASRLPRLFGLDRRLDVPNGRYYALNETDAESVRRSLGVNAMVILASDFGGVETWHDPIFIAARNDGMMSPIDGDFSGGDMGGDFGGGGADFGGADGNGGDFGGGT